MLHFQFKIILIYSMILYLIFISYQLSVISYQLSVISYQLSLTLSAAAHLQWGTH